MKAKKLFKAYVWAELLFMGWWLLKPKEPATAKETSDGFEIP